MSLPVDDRLSIHELVSLHGHLADDRRTDELHRLSPSTPATTSPPTASASSRASTP